MQTNVVEIGDIVVLDGAEYMVHDFVHETGLHFWIWVSDDPSDRVLIEFKYDPATCRYVMK